MIWVCRKCKFVFSRVAEPDQCPDCGKQGYIDKATEEEEIEFKKNIEDSKKENWQSEEDGGRRPLLYLASKRTFF